MLLGQCGAVVAGTGNRDLSDAAAGGEGHLDQTDGLAELLDPQAFAAVVAAAGAQVVLLVSAEDLKELQSQEASAAVAAAVVAAVVVVVLLVSEDAALVALAASAAGVVAAAGDHLSGFFVAGENVAQGGPAANASGETADLL